MTEAKIWCAKITVMAKWVDQYFDHDHVGQGLSIKLNKDKTKCRNIHIGLDLAGLHCLQKYAWTHGIFGANGSSKAQLHYVSVCS